MNDVDIIELCYFGSSVRGDGDGDSDLDVLCVVGSDKSDDKFGLNKALAKYIKSSKVIDVSLYGEARLREMWREGHLFAWHLYLEAKPIDGFGDFISLLGKPSRYKNAVVDMSRLRSLVVDVKCALEMGEVSRLYEAGLLYVAARNVGISASWYSDNGLDFSRLSPFTICYKGEDMSMPLSRDAYKKLCMARHASMRGGEAPKIGSFELVEYCGIVLSWVSSIMCKVEVMYEH